MKRMTQRTRSENGQSNIMNWVARLFTLKAVIATVLGASFVLYSPLRISTAKAASLATEIKSDSQYRTEANLYESALLGITGIATMRLETPDDLKQALAIFERARPNLKFFSSKLVVIARSDSTFFSAVKKKASSTRAAEAFIKELQADPKVVSKLDGAASLTTRLEQTIQADAAKLRRVAERLREVAERIKKTSQVSPAVGFGATGDLKLIRAGFNTPSQPVTANFSAVAIPTEVLAFILFAAVVVIIIIAFKEFTAPPGGPDPIAECTLGEVNERYQACLTEAGSLPFPLDIAAKALCVATYLAEASLCLVTP